MMNSVNLVGRLTRTPELRKTNTGKSVTNITLACDYGFGDSKKTNFVNCQAWNSQADFISNFLVKGSLVVIEGSIQSRSYDDAAGRKVYVQEVLVKTIKNLTSRSEFSVNQTTDSYGGDPYASNGNIPDFSSDNNEPILDITSDDLPF